MKITEATIIKAQYVFLLILTIVGICLTVVVISLYQQSKQGKRFTYCDGVVLYSRVQHIVPPEECVNNTSFQNYLKEVE